MKQTDINEEGSRRVRRGRTRRLSREVRENYLSVDYKDIRLNIGFRADIIVEDKVLVELKSVEKLLSIHHKQVPPILGYLI